MTGNCELQIINPNRTDIVFLLLFGRICITVVHCRKRSAVGSKQTQIYHRVTISIAEQWLVIKEVQMFSLIASVTLIAVFACSSHSLMWLQPCC